MEHISVKSYIQLKNSDKLGPGLIKISIYITLCLLFIDTGLQSYLHSSVTENKAYF